MTLWREDGFAENLWTEVADDALLPGNGAVIVTLVRWRRERDALLKREAPVGVEIAAGRDALEHLQDAADRPLVALRFEKFGDGRAFSYAILLRERHAFAGELRAVGDVLLDEIPLMLRCGFTSFEVVNASTLKALEEGRLPMVHLAYQRGAGKGEAHVGTRAWTRRLG